MRTICFGFSRPKVLRWKPLAVLILWYDKDGFDHGYVRFHSGSWNTDFIYQSSGSRTNFMGGDYFSEINIVAEEYLLQVPDDVEAKIGALCVSREGRPYPARTILGLGLVKLLGFIKLKIKNPFPSNFRDCIGEQAAILTDGLGIDCPLDFNELTPKDFRDWLLTVPGISKRSV